jgi:uncharacterized metal-binding protein YceD (DUF177 family)
MKKSFENPYVINVSGMKIGPKQDEFTVDKLLFDQFENSLVSDGKVDVKLKMHRYATHLDVRFFFDGKVKVPCDRCMEPYLQPIQNEARIIYAFDPEMNFEGYEVMHVNEGETRLSLAQEFYDFITLALPLRLIPEETIHQCAPEVLKYLSDKVDAPSENEEEAIDPRWEALKKLKFDEEN